jgi:predicted ArsR family transcriptional regulator
MRRKDREEQLVSVAALGDPIRRSLYEHLVAQTGPVSRDDAAEALQIPRHTAKFHLDRLEDDGLLEVEYRRPTGRSGPGAGRPAKVYRRSTRQIDITLPERHYDVAGSLMAEAITAAQAPGGDLTTALRAASLAFGKALSGQVTARLPSRPSRRSVVQGVRDVLADSGYEPHPTTDGLELSNCPFHALAQEHTSLVCGINHDLLSGLVDELPSARLCARLDPAEGRCCVVLKDLPA